MLHIDDPGLIQFVTYRLNDSLPAEFLARWILELGPLSDAERKTELSSRIEKHLDCGQGDCVLSNPVAANVVCENLHHHNGKMYDLHSWVVMPNHVHVLFTARPGHTLDTILHSWKSYTSHQIGRKLGTTGRLWQPEYCDMYMRSEVHFQRTLEYIEWNPVKAGLCVAPNDWPYSSASEYERAPGEPPGE